jgi:hypothetical protein
MNNFDPTDTDQQNTYLYNHPLVTTDHVVLTPSMPIALQIVLDTVMLHKRSVVFEAIPRMGKTTICNFAVSALKQHKAFQDRFVLHISADPNLQELKRHESIIRIMARTLGLRVLMKPDLVKVRIDVLNEIESSLRNRAGRHLVLFVDELQSLTIEDMENLQYLQNELALHNIDTSLVGFCQTQIQHTITLLRSQGRPELIVRFLNEMYELPHCKDDNWMSQTLEMYDDKFTYPAGSDCTYTEFFLPRAYAAGLRLATSAADIYRIMWQAAKDAALETLPTVFIFEVFRLILIRSMKDDSLDFKVTEAIIKAAVVESKLSNYASHLRESGKK